MKSQLKYYGLVLATFSIANITIASAAVAPGAGAKPVTPPVKLGKNIGPKVTAIEFGANYKGSPVKQVKCMGANRGADSVQSNVAGGLRITTINCSSAIVNGISAKNLRLTFNEENSLIAKTSSNGSTDCQGVFKKWQNDPKSGAFIATWEVGRLVCKNLDSAIPTFIGGLMVKPSGYFGLIATMKAEGLVSPRALYETKIDGVSTHWTGPTIWAKRGIDLNETQNFVFFADGPRKEKQAYIQIFKATKLANGVYTAPNAAADCNNWKNAAGSVYTYPIDVSVAKTNNDTKLDFATEIKGIFDPYWISGKIQKPLFMAIQAKAGGDQVVFARFVLVQPGTDKCAERPSSMLKIDYGMDPMSQFNKNISDANTKIAAFDKWAKQQYESNKTNVNSKPGAIVEVASFIPRHYDSAIMQAIPAYFSTVKGADGKMGAWVPNWKLSEEIPWPKGKRNWSENCYFTTGAIEQAILLGKSWKPDGIFEALVTGLSMFATAWSAMKDVFVSAFVNLATFGACPANFPGQPQEKMPKACSYLKTATKTGLNIAMSAVGVPPEIPSAKSLIEGGAEYLATQAVDYGLKQVAGSGASEYLSTAAEYVGQQAIDELSDYARKKMISEIKGQMVSMTDAGSCPFPAASYQEAKEKGYASWNPANQCGSKHTDVGSDLASMGKVASAPAGDENNAVLWLNLKPNPAGQGRGKKVTIRVSIPQISFPNGYFQGYINEISKYGTDGQLRLFRPVSFSIDTADIGPNGLKVPINLTLNNDDWNVWKQMIQKANSCALNAFYESCVQENAIGNRNFLLTIPQNLKIDISYQWTKDESASTYCSDIIEPFTGKPHCISFGTPIASQTMNFKQVLSKNWGGNYGIPNYANVCPGYKLASSPDTGLPYVTYDWEPDDLK